MQRDNAIDALFEAGCDDALVGCIDGIQYLDFDWEAPNPETVILCAIADVERLPGVKVIRLAGGGLVSMADIAGYPAEPLHDDDCGTDRVAAAINASLELRHYRRYVRPEQRAQLNQLIGV